MCELHMIVSQLKVQLRYVYIEIVRPKKICRRIKTCKALLPRDIFTSVKIPG